jgi:putative DNA primase/helicase
MMRATEVASRLDLRRYPRSWRGRCPCCGYPKATFAVQVGRDGGARLACFNGCSPNELAKEVARRLGLPTAGSQQDQIDAAKRERKRELALALWRGSEPAVGTLADRYLTARGLPGIAASPVLRFRGDTPHPEGGRLPAMIALVCNVAGEPVGIHRTFLARDGSKARVEPDKASLGPVGSGAVRLQPLESGKPLVVGEGNETAASAGRLLGLPAWAAISAGNLGRKLLLPPEIRSVVIAADPDGAGRGAAYDAWLRFKSEGLHVQIAMPDQAGCDFNDLLMAREATNA